jgi:hypothetical protein
VVVTTLVLVEVVAGVAAAEGDEAAGDVVATDGVVAAVEAAAVVEVLALAADVVEPGDVGALPLADAIPQAAPRNPPIDKRAAAARVRLAGWRRRTALRSCGSGSVGIAGSFPGFGRGTSWPHDGAGVSQGSEKEHRSFTEFTVESHSTL